VRKGATTLFAPRCGTSHLVAARHIRCYTSALDGFRVEMDCAKKFRQREASEIRRSYHFKTCSV
jgi:hypothetical protein